MKRPREMLNAIIRVFHNTGENLNSSLEIVSHIGLRNKQNAFPKGDYFPTQVNIYTEFIIEL